MKYYFAKLHPPRADFPRTMTPDELALMQQHAAYIRTFAEKRWAVAFGPVADPQGAYGIGVWEVPDEVDVATLSAGDPVIKANRGFRYEVHPMMSMIARK